jgi:Probable molybdopterin binding domain
MQKIPIHQAVGMILGHDVTRIIPGKFKGPAFKKGHIIQADEVDAFLNIGKEHVFALTIPDGCIHENEAARRIARKSVGRGVTLTEPSEGKVTLVAEGKGLLKVNAAALESINGIESIIFATLHTNQTVAKDRPIAGTRVVPLVIEEERVEQVERLCRKHFPVVEVKPLRSLDVGIVTTGSEVYLGRIEDKFGPIVKAKFTGLGSRVIGQKLVSDDTDLTVKAIYEFLDQGAQLIAVTGGMSVDPDDQTPASIRKAGGEVVAYGAPVLPGAMFMLAHIGNVPVLGLPGCVMYYGASIFDLVVPRILAGEDVTREDIVKMGHGGFCSNCADCRYPVCGFGK